MDDPETGLGRDAVPVSQGALIVVAGHDMESTEQASDIGDMSKGCMRRALRAAGRCSFVLAQCGAGVGGARLHGLLLQSPGNTAGPGPIRWFDLTYAALRSDRVWFDQTPEHHTHLWKAVSRRELTTIYLLVNFMRS
jgi:hypothetical protein